MAQGAHKITQQFEEELCKYTGSPYAIAVDNCSNALFLALYYELHVKKDWPVFKGGHWVKPEIQIPKHTYPSVACEIMHAGGKCDFVFNTLCTNVVNNNEVKGAYALSPTKVMDSALRFTKDMYVTGTHMCLSFTGPYKHLKLGKGGAILTDDINAYAWFKRARFSGRSECSYFNDDFDSSVYQELELNVCHVPPIAGWNFYMMPEIAARGILLMQQFYDSNGKPKSNPDLCLPYPDISKFKIFQQ